MVTLLWRLIQIVTVLCWALLPSRPFCAGTEGGHCQGLVLRSYSDNISDRYYVALYRKLGDPELKRSARQSMFLNLLFKSMKKDVCERRVCAFIKRLLQVCGYQPPTFICAALILLSEVRVVKCIYYVTYIIWI